MQPNYSKIATKAKNINLAMRSRLLLNAMRLIPICALIGLVAAGKSGLLFAIPASFALAVLVELLTGAIGAGSSHLLYGTGCGHRSPREQFGATLNQIRYHKMCQDFPAALTSVEGMLARDPDFSEAWFLKAQILWEGLRDASGARRCLAEILKIEPNKKAPFHHWALILNKEITESSEPLNIDNRPNRIAGLSASKGG